MYMYNFKVTEYKVLMDVNTFVDIPLPNRSNSSESGEMDVLARQYSGTSKGVYKSTI